MHTEKIEFRQVRDFGEVINATFAFIRQNFRKLLLCVLFIGGPFALLSGISLSFLQPLIQQASKGDFSDGFFSGFFSVVSISMLFSSVAWAAVYASVYYFIQLYIEYDEFEISDVWLRVKKEIPVLVLFYLGFLIVCLLATICLFIPGIYTAVAGCLILNVRLAERKGFFDSLSRSFKLVSGYWWQTFGIVAILGIIQAVISSVAVAPLYIIGYVFSLLDPGDSLMGVATSPLAIGIEAIKNICSLLFTCIIIIGLFFHYFSLLEIKEGGGLMAKIRTMGTEPKPTAREEEEEY
jgi:hypothetical protein